MKLCQIDNFEMILTFIHAQNDDLYILVEFERSVLKKFKKVGGMELIGLIEKL